MIPQRLWTSYMSRKGLCTFDNSRNCWRWSLRDQDHYLQGRYIKLFSLSPSSKTSNTFFGSSMLVISVALYLASFSESGSTGPGHWQNVVVNSQLPLSHAMPTLRTTLSIHFVSTRNDATMQLTCTEIRGRVIVFPKLCACYSFLYCRRHT